MVIPERWGAESTTLSTRTPLCVATDPHLTIYSLRLLHHATMHLG